MIQSILKEGEEVVVFIDNRELKSKTAKFLFEMGLELKPMQLDVADFQVSERVGIERKEVNDFLSSIVDGRLFRQMMELNEHFERPVVILEGEGLFELRDIHENSVRGALLSICVDHRIPILWAQSPLETAKFVAQMARREQIDYEKSVQIRGGKRPDTLKGRQEYVVAGLPNVGAKLAKGLLEEFGSVEKVFSASEADLKKVDKIGEKKARDIRRVLNSEWEEKGSN